LYRRHAADALSFARGLVRTEHDAKDLVQEAFAKTISAVANGNGPHENFLGYLFTAIKSCAAEWWNKNSREVPVEAGVLDATHGPTEDDRLQRVFDQDGNERGLAALQSLPARWQTALWYADVLQEPPRKIGPALGMKPNAVSALVRRARAGLRAAYANGLSEEGQTAVDPPPEE
jgi:RNA polymerase sigma factor (sigma-70 family)